MKRKQKTIEIERIDLGNMPRLKELLKNYIYHQYEENAITDEKHLEMEYYLLRRENRLHELFIQELLDNTGGYSMLKVKADNWVTSHKK
jgi:hypothetical protein